MNANPAHEADLWLLNLVPQPGPPPGVPLGEWVLSVSQYIQGHFEYARDVTSASSPIDDLLQHQKGVCQDFAHLMIAILRSCGVPARYVSGYIHRPNKDSQSHAWCEVWLPDLGWFGIDPTNGTLTEVEQVPPGGTMPRSFAIDPTGSYLFAANELSGNVVLFHIDSSTGRLTPANREIKIDVPVSIVFVPHK